MAAAKYSRRPSHLTDPLSPSLIPDLHLLPTPLPGPSLPCGQLVSKSAKHSPTALEDRDYDDIGTRWYKDVIFYNTASHKFTASFGGTHLLQEQPPQGCAVGTIEAEEMHVRLLKDGEAALRKALGEDGETREWVLKNAKEGEVGFVVATREVANASYKRARLVDVGNGNWEVAREVGGGSGEEGAGEEEGKRRRDSGLSVGTSSKWDVVGVVVRRVVVEGEEVKLGEELGVGFWA